MRKFLIILAALLLNLSQAAATEKLPRSTPEAEGVPSGAIKALVDSFMSASFTDLHSIIAMRNGKVIAEAYAAPFSPASSQQLYSCSKTFTAAAVGLAVDDNLLRLDDRLATFFPELLPDSVSSRLADITVRHLLTMTSGLKADWGVRARTDDWTRQYLSREVIAQPGDTFVYDSMSTYLLGAIVQRVTGRPMMQYLQERVLTPIGITDACWEISPEGVNTGGWGMWMLPESMARFGQLLLQNGRWGDRQLISEQWVKQMKAKHVDVGQPLLDDYGLQMWTCRWPGGSRADGAMGQFIFVLDNEDMVIVVTQSLTGKQSAPTEQSWLWKQFMPAVASGALKADPRAHKRMTDYLRSIALPTAQGAKSSPVQQSVSGTPLSLKPNDMGWQTVTMDFASPTPSMTVTDADGQTSTFNLGHRSWAHSADISTRPANSLHAVKGALDGIDAHYTAAASYGWTSPTTLQVKIYYTNWGSSVTLNFDFSDAAAPTLSATYNWSPTSPKTIRLD